MAKAKKSKIFVQRPKKQGAKLQQKAGRNPYEDTFDTIRTLGADYEKKLLPYYKKIKSAFADICDYLKSAQAIEKQAQRKIMAKRKTLGNVIEYWEKNLPEKISRFLTKK